MVGSALRVERSCGNRDLTVIRTKNSKFLGLRAGAKFAIVVVTPAVENVPPGPAGPARSWVTRGTLGTRSTWDTLSTWGPHRPVHPARTGWARGTGRTGGANDRRRHIENFGLAEEAEERGSEDGDAIVAGS